MAQFWNNASIIKLELKIGVVCCELSCYISVWTSCCKRNTGIEVPLHIHNEGDDERNLDVWKSGHSAGTHGYSMALRD